MKARVLTVSDRSTRGEREDKSGPELARLLVENGWQVEATAIVPDDRAQIECVLSEWADGGETDLILTTGGTGFAPRDVTPEATSAVIERPAPGLAEAMRAAGLRLTPHAMLSRGVAGIRKRTLIVNLPGSPQAARQGLEVILPALPHAVALLADQPGAEAGHKLPRPHRHG
ncbi:MAG: MogA/MoaB family molybdenum cofactor biosynthesis protein [Chloroflexota bacterium]